jgi:exocyst complex component 4
MESLLESLAVLGKLGAALDTVAQRIPAEIYSMVGTTLDEVAERVEYTRQGSQLGNPSVGTTTVDGAISVVTPGSFASVSMRGAQVPMLKASHLRLAAFETSSKQADHETLKDFFWTLYSKFDAVTQGLRVVYEVANRIGSVRDHPVGERVFF